MVWYEMLVNAIGVLGGTAGLISIYNARPKKDAIEIGNLQSLIEEEREEREILRNEYHDYREEVNKELEAVKKEVESIKDERDNFLMAIYHGFRCPLPKTVEECPVIKAFKDCDFCDACGGGEESKS